MLVQEKNPEWRAIEDLERLNLQKTQLVIGVDGQAYEERGGLISCLVPAKLLETPSVYVRGVDWTSFPPAAELAWLFDNFFNHYDREVIMLVGRRRDSTGWLYHVPEQVGSGAQVKWKAEDDEMDQFSDQARWVGTIHIHPGDNCSASITDVQDWKKPEKSGLHLIFGRKGSYTIYGAVAGQISSLREGSVEDCKRVPVEYSTSQGKSLEELLKTPPPLSYSAKFSRGSKNWKEVGEEDCQLIASDYNPNPADYVELNLLEVGALPFEKSEVKSLYLLEYRERYYILTHSQHADLKLYCRDACMVPKVQRLRLHLGRR